MQQNDNMKGHTSSIRFPLTCIALVSKPWQRVDSNKTIAAKLTKMQSQCPGKG